MYSIIILSIITAALIVVPVRASDISVSDISPIPSVTQQRIESQTMPQKKGNTRDAERKIQIAEERINRLNITLTTKISRGLQNKKNRLDRTLARLEPAMNDTTDTEAIRDRIEAIQEEIIVLEAAIAEQRQKTYDLVSDPSPGSSFQETRTQMRADILPLVNQARAIQTDIAELIPLLIRSSQ